MSATQPRPATVGASLDRLDGEIKVRGAAAYAYEQPVENPAYLVPLVAAIARGRIRRIDTDAALAEAGVLAVLTHRNAPPLDRSADPELVILQSELVAYRGQIIGGVVADTLEAARHAASLVRVMYDQAPHVVQLDATNGMLVKPVDAADNAAGGGELQNGAPADSAVGDIDAAIASAAVLVDSTFSTPAYYPSPMEPHSTIALWNGGQLTLHCSTQGVHMLRDLISPVLGLEADQVRVVSRFVGGGFGSKVYPHADVMLAALAAQLVEGRPIKLALTRQQMFSVVGYRTPTIQRVRLAAAADGTLQAIAHDSTQQTSTLKEYAEHTAVCSRVMWAAPNRRTSHRLAALDVPPPTLMRAPGEAVGMFALEAAMDELAQGCGVDPVELRIRNEPSVHPESGLPFSSRHLATCLRDGARRFGWASRNAQPRTQRDGAWLVGTGVAASTYPSPRLPGSSAGIRLDPSGRYTVRIGAADIGTGAWTALTQLAADALDAAHGDVRVEIGDSTLPAASTAGFSSGTNSWNAAIVEAAARLRETLAIDHAGVVPAEGIEVTAQAPDNPHADRFAIQSFGAQFAEVRVHAETGEVRVARLLGVFDVGRIVNAKTARSQLLGGMTMGLSMALHETGVLDPRYGSVVNDDLASYHIAAHADVPEIEVAWLDTPDPYATSFGGRGIGEIGVVGTAAAIANAVYNATGVRVRDLPITLDKLL